MANSMPILLLFSTCLFFLLVHVVSPLSDTCSDTFCGVGEPGIRFPFRLKQFQPDEHCVYPGFDLSCNAQSQTTLYLPISGEFIVDAIYYTDQVLLLKDPDDCLPKKLQNLTTSGSNWIIQNYTSFTLFKCPYLRWVPPLLTRVACLDGRHYYVGAMATDDLSQYANALPELQCFDNWTIQIPTADDELHFHEIHSTGTFELTWAEPSCGSCEASSGTCGFKGKKGLETKCTVRDYNGMHLFF
ncbi:hypothetical protein NL676_011142 [Syzygium grande]|nr:hypothetical protein NL676_011142 [Syzygium grande]